METQTVEFLTVSGQTVTAKLFALGSDTEVASASATEATNRKGTYTAEFTDVAAGTYRLIALNGSSVPLASWDVALTLTTATFQAVEIGISSPSIRTAVGLASANLDTQLADLPTVAEFEARTLVAANYATAANQTLILDETNFCLTVLAGTIADAGTSGETYAITRNGSTYTINFTGLDSTGNRTGQTLTKT